MWATKQNKSFFRWFKQVFTDIDACYKYNNEYNIAPRRLKLIAPADQDY